MGSFAKHGRLLGWVGLLILFGGAARGQAPADSGAGVAPASAATAPAQITAESATTWEERGEQVFLLQGTIRIDQGTTVITMGQGIAWVDLKNVATKGPYQINIYGEEGVQVVVNGEKKQSPRGYFSFVAGDIGVRATSGALKNQNLGSDPMFVRAAEERRARAEAAVAPPANPIQQVQNVDPVAPGVPGAISPTLPATPPTPGPTPFFGPLTPTPAPAPGQKNTPRKFSMRPRGGEDIRFEKKKVNGEEVWVVPTPIIVHIEDPKNPKGVIDIEADRMVVWFQGDGDKAFGNMKGPDGETTQHIEFYMAGNVEMRTATKKETETIRAEEVYYDCSRNVAVCTQVDLEMKTPKIPYPVHVKTPVLLQTNAKTFEASQAYLYSTNLPSDPGLTIYLKKVTIEERDVPRRRLFGGEVINPETGKPVVDRFHYFDGRNAFVNLEGVPVFWFPFLKGNVEDPLGPLDNLSFGYSNAIFGFTFQSTWDVFQLLGLQAPQNTRLRWYLDYYSARGPATGLEFTTGGKDLFGINNRYEGFTKAYGIYDTGYNGTHTDILGGDRGKYYFPPPPGTAIPYTHPDWRGRVLSRWNIQDLDYGFTVQAQLGLISDQNFIEQYYQNEWLTDYNQETYVYIKQQQNQWAWTLLAEPRLRPWMTDPGFLPRGDFWLLGQKLFDDYFTLNMWGSAAFANMRTPNVPSYSYEQTDVNVDTGRFNLWSELSLPFTAGPFKIAPYLVGDLAFYTANVNDQGEGRALGGAGARINLPFSRLFPDIQSDFWNVDGIYHKINFTTNYLYERSSASYSSFPQLDRLNDDTTDQALRDLQYRQIFLNPSNAAFLTNANGLVNPQTYAIRRMIDSRIDTMDNMNVFQFAMENRLQTRRGIAASEHVVDWMTLTVGASLFPQPSRDNYGQNWGILEYDWLWNIGDRTALVSNGWMEPVTGGPRVFTFGGYLNRPDGNSLYLGYRQLDPLESKAVVASIGFVFSQKYSAYASTVWDFGVNQQTYGIGFTRTGTDMQLSLGISVNSVTNNFGFQLEFLPILVKSNLRTSAGLGNAFSLMGR